MSDEFAESYGHRPHIGSYEHTPIFCRQPQDFEIGRAVGDNADVTHEIKSWLTTEEHPPNNWGKIGISLKPELQAILEAFSSRARSNGSSISVGSGWLA
jgi:hypothetical protein